VIDTNNLIIFLAELRKSIRLLGISMMLLTVAIFFMSTGLITVFQEHLHEKLYFFSVAGPFLAHVKVAFFGAVYLLMPLLMYVLWKAMGKPFGVTGNRLFWFVFSTCALFYAGTLFCYLVTLPFGVALWRKISAGISVGKHESCYLHRAFYQLCHYFCTGVRDDF